MSKNSLPEIGKITTSTIDGLAIRYAQAGTTGGIPVILTAPWPESIYSFYHLIPRLQTRHSLLLIDLPGFGHSESRQNVMAPEAMGNFFLKILHHFDIGRTHVVAPDVGTPAVLFAAAKQPALFESLVIGGAAMRPDLAGGALKDMIHSPQGALTNVGADGMKPYLEQAGKLTPAPIIEDFRAASAGRRLEEAAQYVRGYTTDLPKLEPLLDQIEIPSLIIAGKNDAIVPPANAQLLAEKLPTNRHMLLDAGHRVWEEAASDYVEAVVLWLDGGYRSATSQ